MATVLGACGGDPSGGGEATAAGGTGASSASGGATGPGGAPPESPAHHGGGPAAGNPDGTCAVPAEAQAADTSSPTTVIGDGTRESCTSEAVVSAVARGGIIIFDCGPDPITITLEETAKIFNDTGPEIVIDGGGLVTLSGGGRRRILYMNTCDEAQVWTTSHCDDQDHPRLTVQNLTFIEGESTDDDDEGGGAIFARGGRLRVINSRFFNNVCDPTGPDLGGAAIRALMQHDGLPLYVVNSTFGGAEGYGNECANGGGISSIGVSWTVINSLFSHNRALGNGGNPAGAGTPGGGSGGAIYNDGNTMTLSLCGTRIERNAVNAHGSAIFFVTNDHTGNIVIDRSVITGNVGGSWYPTYPQISNHDDTPITVTGSTIE
ncbi:hypothetical protein [Sorangium cellulosum]|nr:hypothetical protein [Sorangium cellulosum]